MIKAILLDVYGTLIDSPLRLAPYTSLIKAAQLPAEQRAEARRVVMTSRFDTVGDAARMVEERFGTAPLPRNLVRSVEKELDVQLASFEFLDGVEESLPVLQARGLKLVLVSNLMTPYKAPIRRLGIEDLVDEVVYSCDEGYMKPEPQIFQIALDRVGVGVSEAVMVGDNPIDDVKGARGAGIRALLLDPTDNEGIATLRGLSQTLERIDGRAS